MRRPPPGPRRGTGGGGFGRWRQLWGLDGGFCKTKPFPRAEGRPARGEFALGGGRRKNRAPVGRPVDVELPLFCKTKPFGRRLVAGMPLEGEASGRGALPFWATHPCAGAGPEVGRRDGEVTAQVLCTTKPLPG